VAPVEVVVMARLALQTLGVAVDDGTGLAYQVLAALALS